MWEQISFFPQEIYSPSALGRRKESHSAVLGGRSLLLLSLLAILLLAEVSPSRLLTTQGRVPGGKGSFSVVLGSVQRRKLQVADGGAWRMLSCLLPLLRRGKVVQTL